MAIQEALKILAEFDDKASPQIKKLNEQLEAVNTGIDKTGVSADKASAKVDDLGKKTNATGTNVDKLSKTSNKAAKDVNDLGKNADTAAKGGLARLQGLLSKISVDFRGFAQGGEAAAGAALNVASTGASALAGSLIGVGAGAAVATKALSTASTAASSFSDEALKIAVAARRVSGSQEDLRKSINASNNEIYALARAQGLSSKEANAFRSAISKQAEVFVRTETPLKSLVTLIRSLSDNSKIAGASTAGAFTRIGAALRAAASFAGTFALAFTKIAGLGVGALVAGVEAIGLSVRKAANETDKLAEKLGISITQLETFKLLASENEGNLQQLVAAYDKISKASTDLARGNKEVVESFAAIGIEQKDIANLSEQEIAGKVIRNYELLGQSAEATTAVQKLLGESFREQIPSIKAAATNFADYEERIRKYGAAAGPELVAAGARQEEALSNLGLAFKGLGIQIAGVASETTTQLAQWAADTIKSLKDSGFVANTVSVIYKALGIVFSSVAFTIQVLGLKIGAVLAQFTALAKLDFKGFSAIGKALNDDIDEARRKFGQYQKDLLNPPTIPAAPTADTSAQEAEAAEVRRAAARARAAQAAKVAADEQARAFASAKEGLESQIRLSGQLTNVEQVLAETINGKYSKFAPAQKQELLNLARKLDAKEKELELETKLKEIQDGLNAQAQALSFAELEVSLAGKTVAEREKELDLARELAAVRAAGAGLSAEQLADLETYVRALNERRAALRVLQQEADVINRLIDGSEAAVNASIQNNIQIAKALLESGKISVLDYTTFIQQELSKVKDANQEVASEASIFWQEAAKGIQGALNTFFFDAMQGRLTNLAASFKKVIDQMVAQALAAKLADALFGEGFATGTGKGGGFIGAAASFFSGILGRERGGDVQAGQPYIVGEKRAELFVPRQNGTILPNLAGVQSSNTNVTFAITAMDSEDVIRSIDKVSRQVAEIVHGASGRYNLRGAR